MQKAVHIVHEGIYYKVFKLLNVFEKSNVVEDPILSIGQTIDDEQVMDLVNREDIDVHIYEQQEVDIWIKGDSREHRQ